MRVRGHHLACTYCFLGSGRKTAEEFFGVRNAIPDLLRALARDPDTRITVAANLDDVCAVCPLRMPDGCGRGPDAVAQNEKLCGWDRAILKALDLREGQEIAARELEALIREKIPDISVFCANCSSAAPSGWAEYREGIRRGLWPVRRAGAPPADGVIKKKKKT